MIKKTFSKIFEFLSLKKIFSKIDKLFNLKKSCLEVLWTFV